MPKRSKSSFCEKSITSNHMIPASKRTSLPRGCKRPLKRKKTLAEIFQVSYDLSILESKSQESKHIKKLNKVMEKVHDVSDDKDDLDVVFDLKEEKKNKVYEVINVASDDETPNQVTYERLYADNPEDRIVNEKPKDLDTGKVSDIPEETTLDDTLDLFDSSDDFNLNSLVCEIVQETMIKDKEVEISMKEGSSTESVPANRSINDIKSDSDDDIVCLAVIDAKTIAEQKKANIEEICLSSDSETIEVKPYVPPAKLKKFPSDFSKTMYCDSDYSRSFGNFSGGDSLPNLFKKYDTLSSPLFSWDSSPSYSPKVVSSHLNEESCSSSAMTNNNQQSISNKAFRRPQKYLPSPCSSSSSSSEEDTSVYWQAERESRWKSNLRYEELTVLGQKVRKGIIGDDPEKNKTLTFKVMSYNILAQQLLLKHRHLYANHDHRALVWPRRWNLIYNEIKSEDPDIMCLQEVEYSQLHLDLHMLKDLGYKFVYKKRTNDYYDGVAVFYKTNLFVEEEQASVEFYQPGVSVLDRDNVGVVVRLRLKESPRNAVVVATTHLLYNPRRSDVKLAQTQLMLAEIDRLAFNKDSLTYYPIILTGDFNLKPTNGVYKLITEGRLEYEGTSRRVLREPTMKDRNILPCVLLPKRLGITDRCQHASVLDARVRNESTTPSTKLYHSEINPNPDQDMDYCEERKDERFGSGTLYHDFNFHSVYEHTKKNKEQEATTFHKKWVTVDYIFYSSTPEVENGEKQREGSLQLLSQMRLPTIEEYNKFVKYMPNFAFGSDHMSLVATFLLKLNCEFI